MSDLTITNAGVAVSANSAGSSISTGRRKIIRVTPTLSTSEYADGDVLFQMTEIPNAVKEDGGTSKMLGAYIIDKDQENDFGVDLMFFEKNTTELGGLKATADIGDDEFVANNFCGILRQIYSVAKSSDIDGLFIYKCKSISDTNESVEPILLQADTNSTSVYVSGVLNNGSPDFASANNLQIVLHIEY